MSEITKEMTKEVSKKMADIAVQALEEKKAKDVRLIDISKISSLGDYFVIATGQNRNQIEAMCEEVERLLEAAGYRVRHIEGKNCGAWVLLDYGDIIVHIFDDESRSFYNLERIWRDGV